MFGADRVFFQRNSATGMTEWYFNAREGVFGPYGTKETTMKMLHEFVEKRKAAGDDGGRSAGSTLSLSLESMEYKAVPQKFDPLKRKKGVDG